jgi:hypothetical protein
MSLDTVRAQVKTIIEAVSGIGEVHDYERYSKAWATYKDFFKSGAHINFVQILRPSFIRTVEGSDATERVTHNFLLKGGYSLKDEDASEKVCQNLVEAICQTFRDKPKLQDTAEVVQYPIVGRIFNGMFGNVLCHIYEIEVSIRERIVFG